MQCNIDCIVHSIKCLLVSSLTHPSVQDSVRLEIWDVKQAWSVNVNVKQAVALFPTTNLKTLKLFPSPSSSSPSPNSKHRVRSEHVIKELMLCISCVLLRAPHSTIHFTIYYECLCVELQNVECRLSFVYFLSVLCVFFVASIWTCIHSINPKSESIFNSAVIVKF